MAHEDDDKEALDLDDLFPERFGKPAASAVTSSKDLGLENEDAGASADAPKHTMFGVGALGDARHTAFGLGALGDDDIPGLPDLDALREEAAASRSSDDDPAQTPLPFERPASPSVSRREGGSGFGVSPGRSPALSPVGGVPSVAQVRRPGGTMAFSLRDELQAARSSFGTSSNIDLEDELAAEVATEAPSEPAPSPQEEQRPSSATAISGDVTQEVAAVAAARRAARVLRWPAGFPAGRRGTTDRLLLGSVAAPATGEARSASLDGAAVPRDADPPQVEPAAPAAQPGAWASTSLDVSGDDDLFGGGYSEEATRQVSAAQVLEQFEDMAAKGAPDPADIVFRDLDIEDVSLEPDAGVAASNADAAEALPDSEPVRPVAPADAFFGAAQQEPAPFFVGESSREIDLAALEAEGELPTTESPGDEAPRVRAASAADAFFGSHEEPIFGVGESSREIDLAALEGVESDADEPIVLREVSVVARARTTGSHSAVSLMQDEETSRMRRTTGSNAPIRTTGRPSAATGSGMRTLDAVGSRDLSPPERETSLASHLVMAGFVVAVLLGLMTGAVALGYFDPDRGWLEGVPFLYDFWNGLYPHAAEGYGTE